MKVLITAPHECDGQRCNKPAEVLRKVRLGCGCIRWECARHDDTAGVHFLTRGCGMHVPDVYPEDISEVSA